VEEPYLPDSIVEEEVEKSFDYYVKYHSGILQQGTPDHEIGINDEVTFVERIFYNGKEVFRKRAEATEQKFVINNYPEYEDWNNIFIGHKLNEEYDVKFTMPASDSNRTIAGKEVTKRIKILALKEYVSIPIETFLDDLGQEDMLTVDLFKEKIRKDTKAKKLLKIQDEVQKNALTKIVNHCDVYISKSMLEKQFMAECKKYGFDQIEDLVNNKGFAFLHDDELLSTSPSRTLLQLKQLSIMHIKESSVIGKIIETEKFDITDQDVTDYLKDVIRSQSGQLDEQLLQQHIANIFENPDELKQIKWRISGEKAYAWILSHVNVVHLTEEETLQRIKEEREGILNAQRAYLERAQKEHDHEHSDGHDHDHDHDHDHGHSHEHSHEHSADHGHVHEGGSHDETHDHSHSHSHSHDHGHSHGEGQADPQDPGEKPGE
jgi:FKBP-type peptidyl-prolyl cis-trans isomerase (trigger factor)